MTTAAGAKSEVDVLLRAARANGYKTVPAQGGHKKIVDHRGKPVVDSNGPLIISGTPSEHRWREMTVKRWLAAGVLKVDPFESNTPGKGVRAQQQAGKKGGKFNIADPDVQAKKLEGIKKKSEAEHKATVKLREKWEPIMVKLGGWDKYGLLTQTGDAIFWFGEHRGLVERFPTASAAKQALAQLKKGNTLSTKSRVAVEYFADELLKADGSPLDRYWELVRLSKGLPAREDEPIKGGSPLPDPPPKEVREAAAKANGNGTEPERLRAGKPSLALQAVAEMMVGRTELSEEVLRLGEQIQDMELRERGFVQ